MRVCVCVPVLPVRSEAKFAGWFYPQQRLRRDLEIFYSASSILLALRGSQCKSISIPPRVRVESICSVLVKISPRGPLQHKSSPPRTLLPHIRQGRNIFRSCFLLPFFAFRLVSMYIQQIIHHSREICCESQCSHTGSTVLWIHSKTTNMLES